MLVYLIIHKNNNILYINLFYRSNYFNKIIFYLKTKNLGLYYLKVKKNIDT
jgi:hypothetical protein